MRHTINNERSILADYEWLPVNQMTDFCELRNTTEIVAICLYIDAYAIIWYLRYLRAAYLW